MKFSGYFGRWRTMKAALVVAGALAIAGAVGSAIAISPIVTPPIKWQGGWEARTPGQGLAGVVPAGRNLIMTDIVATNLSTTSVTFFTVVQGSANCGTVANTRLRDVAVPPSSSVHLPLQTGIGFAAGHEVCVQHTGANAVFNFRGFLFTAAPAS